jgi:hypothetical protein
MDEAEQRRRDARKPLNRKFKMTFDMAGRLVKMIITAKITAYISLNNFQPPTFPLNSPLAYPLTFPFNDLPPDALLKLSRRRERERRVVWVTSKRENTLK